MAVVFSNPTPNWGNFANATSASFSVTAGPNQYLIVSGFARDTVLPNKPTISSTTGLTFTEVITGTHNVSNPRLNGVVWIANASAGFAAKTVTISSGGGPCGGSAILVTDISGVHATNEASGGDTAGGPTLNLAAIGAGNAAWCSIYSALSTGGTVFSPWPTGYTKGSDVTVSTGTQHATGWDAASPGTSLVFGNSGGTNALAFAGELVAVPHQFYLGAETASSNSKAGTTLAVTIPAGIPAGKLVLIGVGCDNLSGADAATQGNVLSIADSGGNSYTLAAAYQNGQGASQAGAGASLWWKVLTSPIAASGTITVTTQQTSYARAVFIQAFDVGAGAVVSVVGTAGVPADGTTDPVATVSSLPAATEYLFAAVASEESGSQTGAASGFTLVGGNATSGGSGVTNQSVTFYYAVETATTKTFTPASGADSAAVLVAFKSVVGPSGYIAATETGADTAALSGTLGSLPVTGSIGVQETGSDTAASTGTVAIAGTFNPTETGADTASFPAGKVAVAGTLSVTESGADTSALTGTVALAGALAVTESGADTAAFTGTVADVLADIVGNLAATEAGADTAAFTGAVPVAGTFTATETGSDTAAFTGTVTVTGSLAAGETGADLAALVGAVTVAASFTATETGADTAALAGGVSIGSSLAATEAGSDTAALFGGVRLATSLAAVETGPDVAALTSTVSVSGNLAASEAGSDNAAFAGTVAWPTVTGTLAVAEVGTDTASLSGQVTVASSLVVAEVGADTAFINLGQQAGIQASLDATEAGEDSAALTVSVKATATFAATEVGADTGSVLGLVGIAGSLVASEVGTDAVSMTGSVATNAFLNTTEVGADTAAIVLGQQPGVTGSLAAQETGEDTAALAGIVRWTDIGGILAATEVGADNAAINGAVTVAGSLATTEVGTDTAAVAGATAIAGTIAGVEVGADTAFINMGSGLTASLAAQETGSDTAALSGTLGIRPIFGDVDAAEAGADTAAFDTSSSITGQFGAIEPFNDSAALGGKVAVAGYMQGDEGRFSRSPAVDQAAIKITVEIAATMAAQESGEDDASMRLYIKPPPELPINFLPYPSWQQRGVPAHHMASDWSIIRRRA